MAIAKLEVGKDGKLKKTYVPVSKGDFYQRVPNPHWHIRCPGRFLDRKGSHFVRPKFLNVYEGEKAGTLSIYKCPECGRTLGYRAYYDNNDEVRLEALAKKWPTGTVEIGVALMATSKT